MIKSIKDLNFDKEMNGFINQVEEAFNDLAADEVSEMGMLDWINENIRNAEDQVFKNLSEREQFLYAFGILSAELNSSLES